MDRKPRLLSVGEASYLNTGYSTYTKEILTRLYQTGKYEIAELASYGSPDDPRRNEIPWKYFPNLPGENPRLKAEYNSDVFNQFGAWKFNDVCLEFKPDIVWDIRDQFMFEFEEHSPFRDFYRWLVMPTVDASPQNEQWLSSFINADGVLTYSDWGLKILREEGGGLIRTLGSASPGVDLDVFFPMDKAAVRKKFSMEQESFIVGTVMRNQGRKNYPELIGAFAEFLSQTDLRVYLYLHTSYPDQGWDIPRLIKQSGIANKILVTYVCRNCHAVFPAFFQDACGICGGCGSNTAVMPNVDVGVDRESLARIINTFDVYVQYANSEGFGMPQVEAAACGVPVFATDYSAMSDVVRKVGGYPIKVSHLYMDVEFGCYRAIPDRGDFVRSLGRFFSLPESIRKKKSFEAREGTERYYRWDLSADKWMSVIDSLSLLPAERWESPSRSRKALMNPPEFPSNEALVEWGMTNILGKPELLHSYMGLRMIRDLNWGSTNQGMGKSYSNEESFVGTRPTFRPFTPQDALNELHTIRENFNRWEDKRCLKIR